MGGMHYGVLFREKDHSFLWSQHHLFMNADVAYIEELAFHYFDNQAETENRSLPKPQEFSLIPPEMDGGAQWSYDCKTRVVIADFSRVNVVTWNEKLYLGKLMERHDITVVCEGLFGQLEMSRSSWMLWVMH